MQMVLFFSRSLNEHWGPAGIFVAIAGVLAASLAVAPLLPGSGLDGERASARTRAAAPPPIERAVASRAVPHGGCALLCDHWQLLGLC